MPRFYKHFSLGKACVVLFLLLLAAAQGLYVFKSHIVQQHPKVHDYLAPACLWLNHVSIPCQLEPARNIKQLSIEDTALTQSKIRGDVIKLSGTLINTAQTSQAFPLLELNLTNAQDIVVLRRYLTPLEYTSNPNQGIPALSEHPFTVGLIVEDLLDGIAINGYRVKIVY